MFPFRLSYLKHLEYTYVRRNVTLLLSMEDSRLPVPSNNIGKL